MGDRRAWVLLAALTLAITACSDAKPDPTLAPGTTATSTTSTAPTTEAPPVTTEAPTTTEATTTTEDPDARRAEIQALVEEAHIGRLQAIYDEDADALLRWVGSQAEYEDGLEAMERLNYLVRPTSEVVSVIVDDVLLDRADCVVTVDTIGVGDGVIDGVSAGSSTSIGIWWPSDDGRFLHGAVWQQGTPEFQWIEECDIAIRGVTP
ncbi:MAG: hypothetical protein HKN91_10705 [Acidimicrobiia bacterium]|nr:hypothetical protein [Acidimicrobiia bacterium]